MATSPGSDLPSVIRYHRRNDRTPEKQPQALTDLDRKRISQIRAGIENARKKANPVNRNESTPDREQTVEPEQSSYPAGEQKLQNHLVDMYNSTQINDELRQRLPRANKTDPVRRPQEVSSPDSARRPQEVSFLQDDYRLLNNERRKSESDRPKTPIVLENIEKEVVTGSEINPVNARKVLNFKSSSELDVRKDTGSPLHGHAPYTQFYPLMAMPPPMYYSQGSGLPYSHRLSPQTTPQFSGMLSSPNYPPILMQTVSTPDRLSACSQSQIHSPYSNLVSSTPATKAHVPVESSKQVALLLTQLENAKLQNKKLSENLSTAEQELEIMKASVKSKEAELLSQSSETKQAASIIQDVYESQRKRDGAMMGRIEIANQERDEVLGRLNDLSFRLEGSDAGRSDNGLDDDREDRNIDQLFSHLGLVDDGSKLEDDCTFLHQLEAIKQRQRDITAEEMHVLMEQRDVALAKCRKLEDELIRNQRQASSESAEQALRAKLAAVEQERNVAVTKVRMLEDENEKIRIYYSLHKSLSQETILRGTVNNTLDNYESKLKEYDGEVEMTQKENNRLVAQLRTVIGEKAQLTEQLNKAQAAVDSSKTQNEKLQRLVHVLRKKLNALGGKQLKSDC
ncbi:hypothetical protein ScPMuIL_013723 [Solemya velum]